MQNQIDIHMQYAKYPHQFDEPAQNVDCLARICSFRNNMDHNHRL